VADNSPPMIVFYDGLCGFCDSTVQYILARDRQRNRFTFAPLQSDLASEVLPKHGKNPKDLNTLYLLIDRGLPTERVLQKSSAAVRIGKSLGGGSAVAAFFVGLLPRPVRDWGYDRFAKVRYKVFGKLEACRIPAKGDRAKFIGMGE
jgi:predicted DCC family thiol-disulfide oxidoreductase YuxK